MPDRCPHLKRPTGWEAIGCARIKDESRYVRYGLAGEVLTGIIDEVLVFRLDNRDVGEQLPFVGRADRGGPLDALRVHLGCNSHPVATLALKYVVTLDIERRECEFGAFVEAQRLDPGLIGP